MNLFLFKEVVAVIFLFCCLTFLPNFNFIDASNLYLIISGIVIIVLLYPNFLKNEIKSNLIETKYLYVIVLIGSIGLFLANTSLGNIVSLSLFQNEPTYYIKYKNIEYIIIKTIIIAPLLEELLFRKIIFERIKSFLSPRKSIVISSLIFTSFHLYGDVSLVYIFFIGVFLSYIYLKTSNLSLIIITHCFLNFLGITYLMNLKYIDSKIDLSKINFWILFIVIGCFLFYLSFRLLKNNGKFYRSNGNVSNL